MTTEATQDASTDAQLRPAVAGQVERSVRPARAIEFTEEELLEQRNKFAAIDGRMLPRYGKGPEHRSGKCAKCGARSWPYATCAKHRELGSVLRALKTLEARGDVVRLTDGRGKKGGALWKAKPKTPFVRAEPKIGRNELCKCGSGAKYKHCCLRA